MESTGDKLEKEIHFWPEKESFRHSSNDNSEIHANPISVKTLLVMGVVDSFCICKWNLETNDNTCFYCTMTNMAQHLVLGEQNYCDILSHFDFLPFITLS